MLNELATRCEAATGPDRELDVAIGLAGKFYIAEPRYPGAEPMIGYVDADGSRVEPGNGAQDSLVPRYTASLDAALTLVPEGTGVRLDRYWIASAEGPVWSASISSGGVPGDPRRVFETWDHATPALALCAAALRARAAQAIEARRAETGTGSVHESAVGAADAPETTQEGAA